MALGDFNFDPVTGWLDEDKFPPYPARDQVRPLFQKLFDQIKVYLGLVKTEITTHLADVVTDADGAHGLKIETGTFTPYIAGTTTPGTNTYSLQAGIYRKIGNVVFFNLIIGMTAKDASMAGAVAIYGLPFASSSKNANLHYALTVGAFTNIMLDSRTQLSARVYAGGNSINLIAVGTNIASTVLAVVSLSDTSSITLSGFYEV